MTTTPPTKPKNNLKLASNDYIANGVKVASDATSGFADRMTSGYGVFETSLTKFIREVNGTTAYVDESSLAYSSGEVAADIWLILFNTIGYATGAEITIFRIRIAPWGNRTGNPKGELPSLP